MTTEDSAALRFVREEFNTLRTVVREDITAVRTSIDTLAHDLRAFVNEQLPRIAVLERRAEQTDQDLAELKAQRAEDKRAQEADRRSRTQIIAALIVGLIVAVVSAVMAWLPPLLATP